ncbi:peptide ABC transporter permease [Fictibacillus nanhaiensis]|uniref:ABC transporter permease subunit n=1 Tax=Fictibacillus nanhaiensis TaxID=742169 RepID=UPI001C961FBA|nr:ABC transporter permease subunit [Fictibacillus nanhaiensis]MBY6037159.1 peptide ABC transporter permease [Fictibacillus nanhaiensis]
MVKNVLATSLGIVSQFTIAILGIICLGALPGLFNGLKLNFSQYFITIKELLINLSEPSKLTYSYGNRLLFPEILIRYQETFIVFILSFFFSILLAIIIVYFLMGVKERTLNTFKSIFLFLESIPDILLIVSMQFFIVWLYKKTNILFVNIAAAGDEKVRALPILALSIPTTIMFIKLLLLRFQTEFEKNYILLAKSKGLGKFKLFYNHVLRNVLLSLFFFTKTSIWFMLSNLYIIEYFFNSIGILIFVKDYNTIEVFTVSLLLIYLPIFIYLQIFKMVTPKLIKEVV